MIENITFIENKENVYEAVEEVKQLGGSKTVFDYSDHPTADSDLSNICPENTLKID